MDRSASYENKKYEIEYTDFIENSIIQFYIVTDMLKSVSKFGALILFMLSKIMNNNNLLYCCYSLFLINIFIWHILDTKFCFEILLSNQCDFVIIGKMLKRTLF